MFSVQQATLGDLPRIATHNQLMARETEGLELDMDVLRSGVRRVLDDLSHRDPPPAFYLVARARDQVIGQLMVTTEWSDWRDRPVWWIQSVYVVPEWRRRGVFAALYQHTHDAARAAGAAGLRLYVDLQNKPAQAVYERIGMDGQHYRLFEQMFKS